MKTRLIIHLFILLTFTGCALVPLSLNGDSDKGLKQSLAGNWVSLDGNLQIIFDNAGNVTLCSSVSNKGTWNVTNGQISLEIKQTYNGSAWVDMAAPYKNNCLYHVFGGQNKLVFSPACNFKIGGYMNPLLQDGQYLAYFESARKTSASSPYFTTKVNVISQIASDKITVHQTVRQDYTGSFPSCVSVSEFTTTNFDVIMDVFWKDGFFTIQRQITNYHTINGVSQEISQTNSTFADQAYYINGGDSEGVSMVLGNSIYYSNQVFQKK